LEKQGQKIEQLEQQLARADFWADQDRAREISRQYEDLKSELDQWQQLKQETDDLADLVGADSLDNQLEMEIQADLTKLQERFRKLDFALLFSGPHDQANAILSIHAGTGGVDAQDWAEILLRMYLKFCQNHNFFVQIVDQSVGSEAGLKSVTLEIVGRFAYGWLKSENGVHRLVRISPFDAEKMRHTSFCLVEVLPETEAVTIELKAEDLKIEVMRASGHGGQSVNTTDSAVRITHLPTKISVKCQNERSQLQNKKTALRILKSKLLKYYETAATEKTEAIKGEYQQAQWGNQARSYVMQPYQLVKDHRTDYETQEIGQVLDGDLDGLVVTYLRQLLKK